MAWVVELALAACLAGMLAADAGAQEPAIPRPRLGLFVSEGEIAEARRKAEALPWAKAQKERIIENADAWVARGDAWIRSILPPPGSKFAYGTAGCPVCGKGWKAFGADTASFDRPLALECPHCHTVFDLKNPSGPYADFGDGVVVNGRRFWLRGVWNAFVTDQMWTAWVVEASAVPNLADAYALTGDPKYAHTLAVIVDALATLAPTTRGPRDFSDNPNEDAGRFALLTSIVFRALSPLSRALDIAGGAPEFDEPSPTNPAKTVWQNVRGGLYEDYLFVPIDTRDATLHTLHNHEADSYRGLALTGLLFGQPDYVRWAAEGFEAFLDNTIDRDGLYYETSLSYTNFTRTVFCDIAEALARYDPASYPADATMPAKADLPWRGNFFNHPRFARLTLDQPARVSIVGREPTYGNSKFDTSVWLRPGRPIHRSEFEQALLFMRFSSDPAIRSRAAGKAAALLDIVGPPSGTGRTYSAPLYGEPSADAIRAASDGDARLDERSAPDVLNHTGLALLRSGEGANRRGALMRVGPNMPHSHNDAGALMLFGLGRAFAGDIGYGIFGNHVHLGWATHAIAHNTVVVNQDETGSGRLFRAIPGGAVERFYDGPGVSWTGTDLAHIYPPEDGVTRYRRTVFQMDIGPRAWYWVDLFDVDGGRVHDYSMHSLPTSSFDLSGVNPTPDDGVWTLAGYDPKWTDATWDEPGRSWGQRLTVNGLVRNLPDGPKDAPEKTAWYAPPGNGYGFLYDVKSGLAHEAWSATWRYEPKEGPWNLRMTVQPDAAQRVITASGPTLSGADKMPFVIVRRGGPDNTEPLRSRFAVVLEAYEKEPVVSNTEAVRQGTRVVGLRVRSGAQEDVILDARDEPVSAEGISSLETGLGVVRRDGDGLRGLILCGGPRLEADGFAVRLLQPVYRGRVSSTDDDRGGFSVFPALSPAAKGSLLVVRNAAYRRPTTYRVERAENDGFIAPMLSDTALARGRIFRPGEDGFESSAPLVFAHVSGRDLNGLDGKRVVAGGRTGRITTVNGFKSVRVEGLEAAPGETFTVYDVQTGDTVAMDGVVSLTREQGGAWALAANGPCRAMFPWPVERWENGTWVREKPGAVSVTAARAAEGPVRFQRAK